MIDIDAAAAVATKDQGVSNVEFEPLSPVFLSEVTYWLNG